MASLFRSDYSLMVPDAIDTGERLAVEAPFDRSKIAEVAVANEAAVSQALAHAARLHADYAARLPTVERIEILERAGQIMQANAEQLALESAREGGKPLLDSRVEVARAIDCLKICVETLRSDGGEVIPMGVTASSSQRLAFTTAEPIGPVVAVSAFNHPLNLIAHQVAPAIAAGCPVIVKPARSTPLSCLRFIQILREAGLPEAWAMPVIPQNNTISTAMVTDPRVAFFSFIGSAKVGWSLKSQLAPGTRCALEHGGVAPVIFAADADFETAVPALVKGGFYHAGQVCVSVQRIFAQDTVAGELATRLADAAAKLKVGDPTSAETEVGPLIETAELERVHSWVEAAVAGGAKLVGGGQRLSDTCYAPTVLLNPSDEAEVSRAEVFGPVVCVYGCRDLDEAIARANSLEVSFQAAVFTREIDTALRCYKRLNASAVMVNDHTAFRVDWMPFAGLRHSGYNVGGIPHTLHDMQIQKMMVMRSVEL